MWRGLWWIPNTPKALESEGKVDTKYPQEPSDHIPILFFVVDDIYI